jgi:chemotaxis signal transduction protein
VLDAAPSIDEPQPAAPVTPTSAPAVTEHLAQGIVCGTWALALRFEWARTIVEQFELVPVPKAPVWLVGAANVEGSIIPVVDLALYINPQASPEAAGGQGSAQRRLLVGGFSAGSTEDAVAIVFSQLPQQLRYQPRGLDDVGGLPARLREICAAHALDAAGQMFLEIDTERFTEALAQELSVL